MVSQGEGRGFGEIRGEGLWLGESVGVQLEGKIAYKDHNLITSLVTRNNNNESF